jgi:hypothetical protein
MAAVGGPITLSRAARRGRPPLGAAPPPNAAPTIPVLYSAPVKLPQAFYHLPLRFDAERQAAEVAAFAESEWRRHNVLNPDDRPRIHLVADTVGSEAFWQLVGEADRPADASAPAPRVSGGRVGGYGRGGDAAVIFPI